MQIPESSEFDKFLIARSPEDLVSLKRDLIKILLP
jgi:hypothetical protein